MVHLHTTRAFIVSGTTSGFSYFRPPPHRSLFPPGEKWTFEIGGGGPQSAVFCPADGWGGGGEVRGGGHDGDSFKTRSCGCGCEQDTRVLKQGSWSKTTELKL
jgi:hypothetical protein